VPRRQATVGGRGIGSLPELRFACFIITRHVFPVIMARSVSIISHFLDT
jgi:hypothetical protein